MKKKKRIKEVFFLWYSITHDHLFELSRDTTNDMIIHKALHSLRMYEEFVLIGLIEIKYK